MTSNIYAPIIPSTPTEWGPLGFWQSPFSSISEEKNYQSGIFARTASHPLYARQAHAPELEALTRIVIYLPVFRHLNGLPPIHLLRRRRLKFKISIPLLPFSYTRHFSFSALVPNFLFATGFGLL